ncbi:MAG: transcriptional regulator [Pseudonocardiaceae bacterium]|nr:transcriptional regulator [Pseudonocardiaceae bacterium]
MPSSNPWTGHTAVLLQRAMRLSNARFAAHLKIGLRTVADWHKKPALTQNSGFQQALDNALQQASPAVRERFAELLTEAAGHQDTDHGDAEASSSDALAADAERRLTDDPHIAAALDWLDQHAGWTPGTGRTQVIARLARVNRRELEARGHGRARVSQPGLTWALTSYYGESPHGYRRYGARYGPDLDAATTVLTRPEWLDLDCPLLTDADRLTVAGTSPADASLDEHTAEHAVTRLAEALALNVRLVDMPLYRLQRENIRHRELAGQLGVDRFAHYALTMDLLEAELIDTLAADRPALPGSLPLRDQYLPDFSTVLDVADRLCAGGALALCAIARPARAYRGPADYVLLIQERSGHVLNAARTLSVIPKGFHQPITDYRTDAQIGATLLRETEEELLGRNDLDNTQGVERRADPMHPAHSSDPMRWLTETGALHMECTGFGLNLVSGNYEFACLIVIDDEQFWQHYGGVIETNWEASGLRQYSSLDRVLLTDLAADKAWSNEGLFAFLQGLRRLARIGGNRVDLPEIEWELW